jgi:aspartate racemase
MKTIGLLGGMSWESTALYYREINSFIKKSLGGLHSAKCIIHSFDFHEIEECQSSGNWEKASIILTTAAKNIEQIGADFIVICTNTMHKVADEIQKEIAIPILHIADLTAEELINNNIKKVALLGTKYTMEQDFYKSRLILRGIKVAIPNPDGIDFVNQTIYNELCLGVISKKSRQQFLSIMNDMLSYGIEGIILGCTEIGSLIKQEDTQIPLFDTTLIHARKAAEYSIES